MHEQKTRIPRITNAHTGLVDPSGTELNFDGKIHEASRDRYRVYIHTLCMRAVLPYWFLMLNKTVYNGTQRSQTKSLDARGRIGPPVRVSLLVIYDITEDWLTRGKKGTTVGHGPG